MPDSKISALSTATPASTSLFAAVVNATTAQVSGQDITDLVESLSSLVGVTMTNNSLLYGAGGVVSSLAAGSSGSLLHISTAGAPAWLAPGTTGQHLQVGTSAGELTWGSFVPASTVAWSLTHASTQTVSSAAAVALTFDTEVFDTANVHSTVTASTAVTIPSSGLYNIGVSYIMQAGSDIILSLNENASTGFASIGAGALSGNSPRGSLNVVRYFSSAGDLITVTAQTKTGAGAFGAGVANTNFWGYKLW